MAIDLSKTYVANMVCNVFLPDVGGDIPQMLLLIMTDDDVGTDGNS